MKNIFYLIVLTLLFTFPPTSYGQGDPPPPGDPPPQGGGGYVGGGGAPIGGGLIVLLALGTAYGAKKIYSHSKKMKTE